MTELEIRTIDMNALNNNDVNILSLPDEMLLSIFNKLNMVDILYSLVDVNQRFDRLALDLFHIHHHHLNFVIEKDDVEHCSVDTHILDRICLKILPRINEKIRTLTMEQFSMERILDTIDYPQLHSLSLLNCQSDILLQHLKSIIINLISFHQSLILFY